MRVNLVILVLIIGIVFGCGKGDPPTGESQDAKDASPPHPKDAPKVFSKRAAKVNVAATAPALSTDADTWKQQCKDNQKAMEAKYLDKVVEISGIVVDMQRHPEEPFSRVYVGDKRVQCVLATTRPWDKLSYGAKVKIKGTMPDGEWSGTEGALILCEIVDAGEYKPLRLTAEALSKEAIADSDAAKSEYDNKRGLCEGEVASTDGDSEVMLKADPPVRCTFAGLIFGSTLKELKPGQKVEIYGKISIYSSGSVMVLGDSLHVKP